MLSRKFGGGGIQATQQNLEDARLEIIQTLGEDALTAKGNISKQFANIPIAKKYSKTQIRAQRAGVVHNIENDIYNHLLTFFGSYYQDGDFVPQRRITSSGAYSLPYNGEDVYLHWANRGQYYIKTAEHFHSYAFAANSVKARFVVREAQDTPQNNNKGASRFFFPQIADSVWDDKNKELQIPLQHRAPTDTDKLPKLNKQRSILESACEDANKLFVKKFPKASGLLATNKNEQSHLLSHLCKYTRRNDSDFFIHKDLEYFLNRELHAAIKNNIFNLDEIGGSSGLARAETQMLLARAVQDIGEQIISHLAQLEEFQKTLWEKKKFITKTNYIARLGAVLNGANKKIQEEICATICETDAQWNEWKDLGVLQKAKDVFDKNAKKRMATRHDFINKTLSLPLDTSHFDLNFCNIVLSCFDNVEEATDGVLIHSENWQALNLLQNKYREQIKCVYIDPPYNTENDGFLYKDNYKNGSWLSMIHDRNTLHREFLSKDGIIFISIDDNEQHRLRILMDEDFGEYNFINSIVWVNKIEGRQTTLSGAVGTYENILAYAKDSEAMAPWNKISVKTANHLMPLLYKEQTNKILIDDIGEYIITHELHNHNEDFNETTRKDLVFVIHYNPKTKQVRFSKVGARANHSGFVAIYPHKISNGNNKFYAWRWSPQKIEEELNDLYFEEHDDTFRIYTKRRDFRFTSIKDLITNITKGNVSLNHIGFKFSNPKPVNLIKLLIQATVQEHEIVMDSYSGSGTTAHAVINLNREDGGRRKFILVEMGDYFDEVLIKRIKKIIYTPHWKDGKPNGDTNSNLLDVNTDNEPRLIKYHCMESYEDALDNIEFTGEETLFDGDYKSRYKLQWESKGSATFAPGGKLDSPFGYTLKCAGKQKNAVADLPETFNYMAGIRLHSRNITKNGKVHYQIDIGDYGDEEAAFIWRDIAKWTKADYEKERDFIATLKFLHGKKIYTNGDSAIRSATSLSPIFVKLMFAEAE